MSSRRRRRCAAWMHRGTCPTATAALRPAVGARQIGRASCRERGWRAVVAGSSRRRHTRYIGDWSSDVCSSDLSRICFGSMLILSPRNLVGLGVLILAALFSYELAEAQTLRCVDAQGNVSYRDRGAQTGGGCTPDRKSVV